VPDEGPDAAPLEVGYYALDITQPDPLTTRNDSEGDIEAFVPTTTGPVPGCRADGTPGPPACPRPFPDLLWEFTDRSGLTGLVVDEDGNGTGDLAAPWSKPVLTRIRIKTGEDADGNPISETRFVVVVGGGVDPGAKTSPTPSAGNWIYILDAATGVPLWKRQVQGAVPSVAVLDSDDDSFADTIYAGTTVGTMYKVDISTPQPLVDVNVPDVDGTLWSTQRITAAAWNPFPIFQAPTGQPIYMQVQVLFVARLGRFALVFGTGDREDLWTFGGNQGRLYVVVDDGFTPLTAGLPFTEDQYHQVTPDSAALANTSNLLLDPSGGTGSQRGWFMLLDADERVITKAFGVSGILIFSSFQPQVFIETERERGEVTNICTRFGRSRNFVVFAFNGNPVANLDTDTATGVTPGPGPQPPGGEGLDRFLVLDDFVTSPFVEQAHTQNVTGDETGGGSEVPTAESCTSDPRLGAITNILKTQGPSNARYGNYFLRLGQRMSKRGIFYPACIPIAVVQRNWREN
jgi:Tfp pilus tip-associated adhesin PilY1